MDRVGNVYEVSLVMTNGVCVKINDETFMTIRNDNIEPA